MYPNLKLFLCKLNFSYADDARAYGLLSARERQTQDLDHKNNNNRVGMRDSANSLGSQWPPGQTATTSDLNGYHARPPPVRPASVQDSEMEQPTRKFNKSNNINNQAGKQDNYPYPPAPLRAPMPELATADYNETGHPDKYNVDRQSALAPVTAVSGGSASSSALPVYSSLPAPESTSTASVRKLQ